MLAAVQRGRHFLISSPDLLPLVPEVVGDDGPSDSLLATNCVLLRRATESEVNAASAKANEALLAAEVQAKLASIVLLEQKLNEVSTEVSYLGDVFVVYLWADCL
jgi:hypothetical protein